MNFDISHLLEHWDFVPGQVVVRRFIGKDGQEKIQLRVDLGLLQMNAHGRPDGKRPFGQPSMFDHFQARLEHYRLNHGGSDSGFELHPEDIARLQLEALQYHHRCICLLQLSDFANAGRDAGRNLQMFDFVDEFAESDELSWTIQQFRPQVLTNHTQAVARQHLAAEEFAAAIREIEAGIERLREFYEAHARGDLISHSSEIAALQHWLTEVDSKRPLTRREQLERDLDDAVQREDYEAAARARDELKKLKSAN